MVVLLVVADVVVDFVCDPGSNAMNGEPPYGETVRVPGAKKKRRLVDAEGNVDEVEEGCGRL